MEWPLKRCCSGVRAD